MTTRREFLLASAAAVAASAQPRGKSRIGLVHSTHKSLVKPVSPEHPLDYEIVRDMVWKAIGYGKPNAGSLEAKIKPGSWVVLKPNYCFLKTQMSYRSGDDTDMRVVRAVLEYVAKNSKAKRITIAEGGSYRNVKDTANDNVVTQNGQRADLNTYDWGPDEFPGLGGSYAGMLKEIGQKFPDKQFDFMDLAYDVYKDADGKFASVPVPLLNGVGSFSNKKEYFISNTVKNCDFLISLPVAKVHENCGVTCCFKNYVGTGPRIAYMRPGAMTNMGLHNEHSVDTRIDPFIADLSAFHPPDYSVVDMIRGLQYTEHNNRQADQMIRTNMVLAGEDPVALDGTVARLLGFKAEDIDYLHMQSARKIGTYDAKNIEIIGDEPDRYTRNWAKPRTWYARCNRDWRVTGDPTQDVRNWKRHTTFGDMLDLVAAAGPDRPSYSALANVKADGARKGFLWVGLVGAASVELNGREIMKEEGTRYRVGQFRQAIELRPGDNQILFKVQPANGRAQIAAVLVGAEDDGDSLDGASFVA